MAHRGGLREKLKITMDRIAAEVDSLSKSLRAPLRDAVAERLGVTGDQLNDWLQNNYDGKGHDLGIIPQNKITEILCLSLGEHFHHLRLNFTMTDLANILHRDRNSLHNSLRTKKGVVEELQRLGLIIRTRPPQTKAF